MNRLLKALTGLGILGVLAWNTLPADKLTVFGGSQGSDSGLVLSLRDVTLAILALFTVLTVLAYWKERVRERLEKDSDSRQA